MTAMWIAALRRSLGGYLGSLASSYLVWASNVLVQVVLVPLYLRYMGRYEFGLLMILLAVVNYISIGSGWMSGGFLRMLGERAGQEDSEGLQRLYSVARISYVGYALLVAAALFGAYALVEPRVFVFPTGLARHDARVSAAIM